MASLTLIGMLLKTISYMTYLNYVCCSYTETQLDPITLHYITLNAERCPTSECYDYMVMGTHLTIDGRRHGHGHRNVSCFLQDINMFKFYLSIHSQSYISHNTFFLRRLHYLHLCDMFRLFSHHQANYHNHTNITI
jgi:hypothetical protein